MSAGGTVTHRLVPELVFVLLEGWSSMSGFRVRDGVLVEEIDGVVLVLEPVTSTMVELVGDQVGAFRLAESGAASDGVPEHLVAPMAALVSHGLVEGEGWDRRRVLLAGGAAAAAAIVVLALPSAAAAQSAPGGGGGGGGGPVGATVPGLPSIVGIGQNNDRSYVLDFIVDDDGGSPVTSSTVYVNGVYRATGSSSSITFFCAKGDSFRYSVSNAIGEGPLTRTYPAP